MAKNFVTQFRGECCTPDRIDLKDIKEECLTPDEEIYNEYFDKFPEDICGKMRKSLSMTDVGAIREELVNLDMRDDNNKVDVYNRYRRTTLLSNHSSSKEKFVSLAEAIYHFQRDTPSRFHSSQPQIHKIYAGGPLKLTRPQSPKFHYQTRPRTQHILSQKQIEDMEYEELKKWKIKANPVPKSVIQGSQKLPDVPRKPNTVVEPFKLTEVSKKLKPLSPMQKFKARPAPKDILEKPQIPVKNVAHFVKPKPSRTSSMQESHDIVKEYKHTSNPDKKKPEKTKEPLCKTHPVPFSFEKRNEELKRRKEDKIQKQIEEEKKAANQFKANPIPVVIKKKMQNVNNKTNDSTTSSENKENAHFEARPPTVLYKEPFKPILHQTTTTMPVPFNLNSDKRLQERQLYEKQLKEKEEERERLRVEKEQEDLEREKHIIAQLRAQRVHHPKPIAVKSPFVAQKSYAPLTEPETPKFVRRMKQNANNS